MEIVLGASMAPATIRMVLIEGENADGVTVDQDNFDLGLGNRQSTLSGPDQLIAAILGTRQGATEAGYQLSSIGVTWTDHRDAAALATALAARKIDNVMLVSAFLAAAALAQTVGNAMDYEYIAMLFVEPSTATLALIDSADGSVTDVQRLPLRSTDRIAELASMIAGLDAPETDLQGLFVVGCGVDIVPIKPALEAVSRLPVSAPEEPDMALARGAALASANAPLFASSTAALAYAQDPGTGEVDPYAVSPGHLEVPIHRPGVEFGEADLAYSAAPDEEADAPTGVAEIAEIATAHDFESSQRRRPLLLVGSALAVVFVSAALALEIALALGIRPAVALRPAPGEALIAPVAQAPSPPAAQLLPAPRPQAIHLPARVAAPPALHVPAPALIAPPAPVHVPVPVAPVPVPVPVPMHAGIPAPSLHVPFGALRQLPNLGIPQPPSQGSPWQGPMREPSQGSPWQGPMREPSQGPMREPSQASPWQGPMREPFAPGRGPLSPQRGFASQPRMNFPAPEGPRFPGIPAPEGPRFPGMPGPGFSRFPMMPGPMGPPMPMMPAMPQFNFPVPRFRF
ncbi:MAG: hypothetical protein QOD88_1661 [Mycobacterium sp.]|nr:hypothetical protein [Mycobacterium sp.]